MVLRRPVKFNPDKREFVLTEQALSNFDKDKPRKQDSDVFETASDISKTESQISYGNRVS